MVSVGPAATFPAASLAPAVLAIDRTAAVPSLMPATAVGTPAAVLEVLAASLGGSAVPGTPATVLIVAPPCAAGPAAAGLPAVVLAAAPEGFASSALFGTPHAYAMIDPRWNDADTYLVTLTAYAGDGSLRVEGVPVAGSFPAGVPLAAGGLSGTTTLRFSDVGFTSRPDDDPPSTHWEGRASVPLTLDRAIPLTPENERRIALGLGEIEIENGDGVHDDLPRRLAIDGRTVEVHRLRLSEPLSRRTLVFRGSGTGWWADEQHLCVGLRNNGYLLDVALQPVGYTGSGGPAGTPEIKGLPVPQLYGLCRNIRPVLVDPVNLVFQVHDRRIEAIRAVRDRGAPLTPAGIDHPDWASLVAAAIAPGTFHTCLAQGLFRIAFLGGQGQVTADVEGDAAGGYVSDTAGIVRRILLDRGAVPAENLDGASFAALASDLPGTIGWYVTGPLTVAQACGVLMGHCASYWGARRDGRIAVGRLAPPASPTVRLDASHVAGEVERLRLPASIDPPNRRRRVGYRRNWTAQTDNFAAGADVASLENEYRFVIGADDRAAVRHLLSTDPPPVLSLFDEEANAQALADFLIALYAPGRSLLRTPAPDVELGDCITLEWPRHGLGPMPALRVVGISERCGERSVSLTAFG
jgi:hypothetical protein